MGGYMVVLIASVANVETMSTRWEICGYRW